MYILGYIFVGVCICCIHECPFGRILEQNVFWLQYCNNLLSFQKCICSFLLFLFGFWR